MRSPLGHYAITITALAMFAIANLTSTVQAEDFDRSVLPIKPPATKPITVRDARDAQKPVPFNVDAPEGAPNVVIVLIDDIGFGATAPFGGAIETPAFSRLAENGLRHVSGQDDRAHKDQDGDEEEQDEAQRNALSHQFCDGAHVRL